MKQFLLICSFLIFNTAHALDFTVGGINYATTSATTVEVADNSTFVGVANIPAMVTFGGVDYAVTTISNNAFRDCLTITTVNIGDSIITIGELAFNGCQNLTTINMGNSVTTLEYGAFSSCINLNSFVFNDSVTTIGEFAFGACLSLETITIPDSVTSIGEYAFYLCTNLTTVSLSNSLTTVEPHTFEQCTNLASITIPDSVITIGYNAFTDCSNLATVNLGNSLTTIQSDAFAASGIVSINIPDSVTTIESTAFILCENLTTVVLGNSVTSLGWGAFYECTSLTSFTINYCSLIEIDVSIFPGVNLNAITLTVPFSALAEYQTANIWSSFGTINSFTPPDAPLVENTQLAYAGASTIANLTATGNAIQWYTTATGGTALEINTALVSGTTYYATQTVNCDESTNRTALTVQQLSEASQTLCGPTTVASLVSTPTSGATVSWFTTSSGGTALESTNAITTGTYYVEQSVPTTLSPLGVGAIFGPSNIAVQPDGKIVVADYSFSSVKRMNADGTGVVTLASGINGAYSVAIQPDGKILVSDGSSTIKRINSDGSGLVELGSGFSNASGIGVLANGKIVVANSNFDVINIMDANGTNITTLGTGFNYPEAIVIQPDGKILIADSYNNAVKRMNADGTGIETLGSGFSQPNGLAIQSDGKIIVADTGNNLVKRMNADGSGIETIATVDYPYGVAVDNDGKILVVSLTTNKVSRIIDPFTSNRVAVSVTVNTTTAPTASAQTFCGSGTVAGLTPTPSTSIKWYADETGGTALATTTALSTATYYVSQTTNDCESERTSVSVTINSIPTAPTASAQTFCGSTTVAGLSPTPSASIKWYADETGGTALSTSIALSTATYYVSETTNGCESARTAVSVTINPLPTADAGQASVIFCSNDVTPITASAPGSATVINGFQGAYAPANWAFTNTNANGVVNTTNAPTSIILTGGNNGSASEGNSQYAIIFNEESTISFNWSTATSDNAATDYPQVIIDGVATLFQGYSTSGGLNQSGTMTVTILAGQSFAFNMYTVDNTEGAINVTISSLVVNTVNLVTYSWAASNGGTITGSTTNAAMTPATSGTYTVTVTNTAGCSASDAVNVTINTQPTAPTASAQAFCGSTTVAGLSPAPSASIKWYAQETGGTALETTTVLSTTTYYVSQTTNGCESTRTSVSVTINSIPTAPTASAQAFCGSTTVAGLSPTPSASIKWYADETGGTSLATTTALSTTTYYVSQTTNGCESTRTSVSVTINSIPTAPTASAQAFCGSTTVAGLSPTPSASIKWYTGATGGTTLATTTALSTATYYVSQTTNGCESARASVSVTINSIPTVDAGTSSVTFCSDAVSPIMASSTSVSSTNGFQGAYAIENWNFLNDNSDGILSFANASGLQIYGGNNSSGNVGNSSFSILCLEDTSFNFNWAYASGGSASDDYPEVLLDGMPTLMTGFDDSGSTSQSGTMLVNVLAGQTFAFNMHTVTNQNGGANVSVSNMVISKSDASYSWAATAGGSITGSTTTAAMTPATSGTYTVTVTNTAGCSASDSVNVTINPTSDNITTVIICSDSYTWNGTTYTTSGIKTGTTTNCVTEKLDLSLFGMPTAPTATAQSFCGTTTVSSLSPAIGSNLNWYANATTFFALSATDLLETGTYYVAALNDNGCESTRTAVSITVTPQPTQPTTACYETAIFNSTSCSWVITGTQPTEPTDLACYETASFNSTSCSWDITGTAPSTPTGSAMQTLPETNATIENIVVSPTNVIWYASEADALAGINPLSSTTILTTDTTYYAVNYVGGCASTPFAVAITVTLGTNDFEMFSFSFYPNPTLDVVNIKASKSIDEVTVINMLGQTLIAQKTNNSEVQIDLTKLPTATYFVKVTVAKQEKIIKVIKK